MPTPEISVQLYSIHAELDADLDGSLSRLAETGLRTVEAFDFVRHRKGAELDLNVEEARRLVVAGAVVPVDQADAPLHGAVSEPVPAVVGTAIEG